MPGVELPSNRLSLLDSILPRPRSKGNLILTKQVLTLLKMYSAKVSRLPNAQALKLERPHHRALNQGHLQLTSIALLVPFALRPR